VEISRFNPRSQHRLNNHAMTYREISDDHAAVIGQGWEDLEEMHLWPSDLSYISAGIKSSIQAGLANGNEEIINLPATSPGGNCKFNDYSSLAVCVSFADVTEHLYATNNTISETVEITTFTTYLGAK
jgi:hypothetical protein